MILPLTLLALCFLLTLAVRRKKHVVPTITEEQKQADELITVILPTINNDHH